MTEPSGDFVLVLSCPDRPGIVHAVSGFLLEHGGNIVESQQFNDVLTDRFFLRVDFAVAEATTAETLRSQFTDVAGRFGMDYELWDARAPYRTLVMVSKQLHCLNDLLFRASTGAVQIDVPAVVSNHPDAEKLVRSYGLDFVHLPVTPGDPTARPRPRASCSRWWRSTACTWWCSRATCRCSPTTCAASSRAG